MEPIRSCPAAHNFLRFVQRSTTVLNFRRCVVHAPELKAMTYRDCFVEARDDFRKAQMGRSRKSSEHPRISAVIGPFSAS